MTACTEFRNLSEQTERVSIDFLRSDIDLGFTFLRLAEYYNGAGSVANAAGLIAKATLAYKTVINATGNLSTKFEKEKRGLRAGAQRLLDAILAAQQRLDSKV